MTDSPSYLIIRGRQLKQPSCSFPIFRHLNIEPLRSLLRCTLRDPCFAILIRSRSLLQICYCHILLGLCAERACSQIHGADSGQKRNCRKSIVKRVSFCFLSGPHAPSQNLRIALAAALTHFRKIACVLEPLVPSEILTTVRYLPDTSDRAE